MLSTPDELWFVQFLPDRWAIRRGTREAVAKGGKNRLKPDKVRPLKSLEIHGLPWMQDGECRCELKRTGGHHA